MSATVQNVETGIARTLRISITGECNLECFYCKPLGHTKELFVPKTPIQPSDVSKLVKIVGELGVNRVLISGGEPLLRKDAANFVKSAYAHKGISDVRLITNGTYLKAFSDALRKMGLRKVDINFDTLRYERYQALTKRDDLFRVLDGIEKVERLNFIDIRLNILLLSGINEDEVVEFARMTKDRKLHVRFMEYAPNSNSVTDPYAEKLGLSVVNAKHRIDDYQKLVQIHDITQDIPYPTFQFADGIGKISFLSKVELQQEMSIPTVVFNADGVLYNEAAPSKVQPILADLRRDAKEVKLHRTIEKVMMLSASEDRPSKVAVKPAKPARAAASARR